MAFYTNAMAFPNLEVKGFPNGADSVLISDAADNGKPKQALISTLPGGSVDGLRRGVFQVAHGFFVGDVLMYDIGTLAYIRASSDTLNFCSGIVMVASVFDADNFSVMQNGYLSSSDYVYVPGTLYYLDRINSGTLVDYPPVYPGFIAPCFIATAVDAGYFWGGTYPSVPKSMEGLGTSRVTTYLTHIPNIYDETNLTDTQLLGVAGTFASDLVLYPFMFVTSTNLESISISVNTPEALSECTVGIYAANNEGNFKVNTMPFGDALLTGVIDTTVGGIRTVSFASQTFYAGMYWFAIQANSAAVLSLDGSLAKNLGTTSSLGMSAPSKTPNNTSYLAFSFINGYVSGVLPTINPFISYLSRTTLSQFVLASFVTSPIAQPT